ncbi:hypothetical protein [Clostridium sp.]|uniref:hypothetical protein n=1 Tax=Clostridium sp. TaxID=1506 RepID=UPI001A44B5FB|nr:hypothetical protein [Clostridium sp.]MBK5240865.1 hypothetical protein [Clostridium sp.]
MRRIKGRELVKEESDKFVNGLDKYVKTEGIDSKLVNIPTIVTGLNENGGIIQQEIEPYAYEVIDQNSGFID